MTPFDIAVHRIDADHARRLWDRATDTTAFTHPEVLAALTHGVEWWLATDSGQPACLWPICLDDERRVCRPEFAYYLGPVSLRPQEASPRGRLLRAVAVQHKLLESLTRTYGLIDWSTMPGVNDVRPWLWFTHDHRHPLAVPRHTAVVADLERFSGEHGVTYFSRSRRKAVYRAREAGATPLPTIAVARAQELYYDTMLANQAAETARRRMSSVERLFSLVGRGHGYVVACGFDQDADPSAFTLVLLAKGRACAVLAAADAEWRCRGFNAFLQLQALIHAHARHARIYDFNGANSPLRSADKHAYGAEVAMYFDFTWHADRRPDIADDTCAD